MGLAIRTQSYLNLRFPSIVWKQLVGQPVLEEDVRAIDALSFKILEQIHKLETMPDITPELFSQYLDITFTAVGSDQKTYPLVPNGANRNVTWDNRQEFARALKKFRLSEFSLQCAAIRRGLAMVVPYRLLALFTWSELESEVCGQQLFDVELLEKNTIYEGCSANETHVGFFWKMMKELFDDNERAKFLVFVWGRSRLPRSSEGFERKFKITPMNRGGRDQDRYLPVSHTCFFSLELPRYSSLQIMHEKMLYAITHCVAVDADDTSAARAAARRTASPTADDDHESDVDDGMGLFD